MLILCPTCGSEDVRQLGECREGEWYPENGYHCWECDYPNKFFTIDLTKKLEKDTI
jgi:transposase-like protein